MTAVLDEDDLDDLLPDDLNPNAPEPTKEVEPAQSALTGAQTAAQNQAATLAQIVNLHIGGYSLAAIGAAIGATEAEVDRMLANETARYVKNQPALRTYVRNFISAKYSGLLESVYDQATDKNARGQLEYQDRALRVLDKMAKLHGAEAPTQTEVKVDAAPEAVERLVNALAAGQGLGYDTDIFDLAEDDIHEAVVASTEALEVSGNAVEAQQEGEPNDGF